MKHKAIIMGILNVTPDSFSDGGRYHSIDQALNRTAEMVHEGADVIDIGGESSRPGAKPVSIEEELERTIPIVEAISQRFPVRVSIDTRKYEVARQAVEQGATIINDISAGSDIRMAELVVQRKLDIILMHMKGTPESMQKEPAYPMGVVSEVRSFLEDRIRAFEEAGVCKHRIWVDPGIGFGKTVEHNVELLQKIKSLTTIAERLVIGTSRKSFLAHILGDPKTPFSLRSEGTMVTNLWAYSQGVTVFRVHDPGAFGRALKSWKATVEPMFMTMGDA